MSTIDVVIVNWNAGALLGACLRSLVPIAHDGIAVQRVVVVDNDSADGSIDALPDLDLPLEILRNETNRGFASACNQGARGSTADYLLFLNPDTELLSHSISIPVEYLDRAENAGIGIAGIQLTDRRDQVQPTCARFPTPGRFIGHMFGIDRMLPRWVSPHFMTEWNHEDTRPVDQVMGAFFLCRRSLFEQLGGFDERFFVYVEEVDFSFRASKVGAATVHLSTARAYHHGGGTTNSIPAQRLFYTLRSRIIYFLKHHRSPVTLLYILCVFAVEFPVRLVASVTLGPAGAPSAVVSAANHLVGDMPKIFRLGLGRQPVSHVPVEAR